MARESEKKERNLEEKTKKPMKIDEKEEERDGKKDKNVGLIETTCMSDEKMRFEDAKNRDGDGINWDLMSVM